MRNMVHFFSVSRYCRLDGGTIALSFKKVSRQVEITQIVSYATITLSSKYENNHHTKREDTRYNQLYKITIHLRHRLVKGM